MSALFGVLGQSAPNASALTTIYTCPNNKHGTARMLVCNRGSVDLFRIAISPGGAAVANAHYVVYDMPIVANDSLSSAAFTIEEDDVVRVYSANGNLSFTLTGIEEDG
jgi:hypothetical protein